MKLLLNIFSVVISVLLCSTLYAQDLGMPALRSVSVDPTTGAVIIKWNKANDPNITRYEISRQSYAGGNYAFNASPFTAPATDSIYIDNSANAINNRQTYRIRSANATKTSAITSMHVTMLLAAPVYDPCKNEAEFRWTAYKQSFIDANGRIAEPHSPEDEFNAAIKYEVWGYETPSPSPFVEANAVKMGNTIGRTVDTIRNLVINSDYYFFIKALLPNGDTVTTYHTTLATKARKEPAYMNIDSVISTGGNIELYFNVDKTGELDTFALYRNDIKNKPLVWFNGKNPLPAKYIDRDIQLGLIYNYTLAVFRCGTMVKQTDTVNNILLFVTPQGQNTNVKWTPFTNEPSFYEVFRTQPPPTGVVHSSNNVLNYTDNVKQLLEDGAFQYCYYIRADNGKSVARSALQCVILEPVVTVPDAIDPRSEVENPQTRVRRNQFGPILSFADDKYRFTLEVFNKAGVLIFRSNKEFNDALSPAHYWDGKYKNNYVKEDAYIYSLKFEFKDREPFIQRGTVTVVYR